MLNILVFNCGSSSLNYKVYVAHPPDHLETIVKGKAHRVGVKGSEPSFIEHHHNNDADKLTTPINDHSEAARLVIAHLKEKSIKVDLIGHRFVHGGSVFQKSVFMTPENMEKLAGCLPLAPIHNPNSLSVIQECQRLLPGIPQYLTFDTAFHSSLPEWAYTYALPAHLIREYGLRKYGFHGLSYQYVTHAAATFLNQPLESLRMVACHLGTGGSSVAAICGGLSIDTSMGYSPLPGLMMSTRTGDLDPRIPLHLIENEGYNADQLTDLFNKKSGLLGISGFSSDIRDLIKRMDEEKDVRSTLGFDMYVHRLKKYIGACVAVLSGMDALIFTDDIGVQNWRVRENTCQSMEWCGITLDAEKNKNAPPDCITLVSKPDSPVSVLSMPTDEEWVIGMEGYRLIMEEANYADS